MDNIEDNFYALKDDNGIYSQEELTFKACNIFGMTCCGHDVIAKNFSVPSSLKTNDWICFSGMGAYTFAMISNFNAMRSVVNVYKFQVTYPVLSWIVAKQASSHHSEKKFARNYFTKYSIAKVSSLA